MNKEKLKAAVKAYVDYTRKSKQAAKNAENAKKFVSQYITRTGKKIRYNGSVCYCITKTIVEYNIPKLLKRFGKKARKFIDTTARVNDFEQFKRICSENEIPLSLFKPVLSVSRAVNETKLDILMGKGAITHDELEGCYNVTESKTVGLRLAKE